MVNAISNTIYVAGETFGYMTPVLRSYEHAKTTWQRKNSGPHKSKDLDLPLLQKSIRHMVMVSLGSDIYISKKKIVGIKEIRHTDPEELDLLREVFPKAKFILNWREDTLAQGKSAFYKKQAKNNSELVENLTKIGMLMKEWSKKQPKEVAFNLPLETWNGVEEFTPESFNNLIWWLGFEGCRFKKVIHSNNNGNYFSDPEIRKGLISGDCVQKA
ncbi:hypothetical protein ScalyP_jg3687 [Parmales sp. scaly parma]|nr:hypothetical protein ScalyP_jg3687 [Parmales sp. scaly parma]